MLAAPQMIVVASNLLRILILPHVGPLRSAAAVILAPATSRRSSLSLRDEIEIDAIPLPREVRPFFRHVTKLPHGAGRRARGLRKAPAARNIAASHPGSGRHHDSQPLICSPPCSPPRRRGLGAAPARRRRRRGPRRSRRWSAAARSPRRRRGCNVSTPPPPRSQAAQERRDVVVVDRQQVREGRRRLFGLALPRIPIFGGGDDDDDGPRIGSDRSRASSPRPARTASAIGWWSSRTARSGSRSTTTRWRCGRGPGQRGGDQPRRDGQLHDAGQQPARHPGRAATR